MFSKFTNFDFAMTNHPVRGGGIEVFLIFHSSSPIILQIVSAIISPEVIGATFPGSNINCGNYSKTA